MRKGGGQTHLPELTGGREAVRGIRRKRKTERGSRREGSRGTKQTSQILLPRKTKEIKLV